MQVEEVPQQPDLAASVDSQTNVAKSPKNDAPASSTKGKKKKIKNELKKSSQNLKQATRKLSKGDLILASP